MTTARHSGIVAPIRSRADLRQALLTAARRYGGQAVQDAARAFDASAGQLALEGLAS